MSGPFDREELMNRVDGDAEFLAETVAILDEDSPSMLDELRAAAAAGDAERLAMAAHAFKGMAANFCAEAVAATALRLEAMGRDGNVADAEATVATLVEEAAQLSHALHVLVESLQA